MTKRAERLQRHPMLAIGVATAVIVGGGAYALAIGSGKENTAKWRAEGI
jgi:hypothetical protein